MNVTAASNTGELHRHDPRLHPRSVILFNFFRDVFFLGLSSLSVERRRASQRGWPVRCLAKNNARLNTEINLLLSLEKAKSRGPHALEHRRADTYHLARHLDSPADGSLSAASHVRGKHHFVFSEHWRPGDLEILGKVNAWRDYRMVSSVNGEGSGRADKDGDERLATSASGDSSGGCDSLHGVHNVLVERKERRRAVGVLYSPFRCQPPLSKYGAYIS